MRDHCQDQEDQSETEIAKTTPDTRTSGAQHPTDELHYQPRTGSPDV